MRKPFLDRPIFQEIHWLTTKVILLVFCWIVSMVLGFVRFEHSINSFNEPERPAPEWFKYLLRDSTKHPARYNTPPNDPSQTVDNNHPKFYPASEGPRRTSGNNGHAQIDFGGQYMMGRLMAQGYGRDLYNRNRHWQVLNETYKTEYEQFNVHEPSFWEDYNQRSERKTPDSDVKNLMNWTMGPEHDSPRRRELAERVGMLIAGGTDPLAASAHTITHDYENNNLTEELNKPSLGGALYPPVHALLYAPLGMIDDPRVAYVIFQTLSVLAMYFSGYCARIMTNGRIWTPVATIFLMLIPGCRPGIDLGQNQSVTLAILFLGWALACRNRPLLGGIVWGFLAFKPVWAIAFGLVPLFMFRFRFLSGMVGSGLTLCALTLPFVGVESWFNWLENGKNANGTYNTNENWIKLSRDLSGVVRRFTIDMTVEEPLRNKPDVDMNAWKKLFDSNYVGSPTIPKANLLSWVFLLSVFGLTAFVYWGWGNSRELLGLSTGFLMLGCHLSCYRFMYYDSLLAGLGLICIFAYPGWFFRWSDWQNFRRAAGTLTSWVDQQVVFDMGQTLRASVKIAFSSVYLWVIIVVLMCDNILLYQGYVSYNDPSETYCFLALWLYSGILLMLRVHRPEDPVLPVAES